MGAQSPEFDVFTLSAVFVREFSEAEWIVPIEYYYTEEEKADMLDLAVKVYSYKDTNWLSTLLCLGENSYNHN